MRHPFMWLAVVTIVALGVGSGAVSAAAHEEDLYRQMKVDVFDGNWSAVLRAADEILARYPDGSAAPQAAYHRARALARIAANVDTYASGLASPSESVETQAGLSCRRPSQASEKMPAQACSTISASAG